jgi:hypothetical protein
MVELHLQRPCFVYVLRDTRLPSEASWINARKRFSKEKGEVHVVQAAAPGGFTSTKVLAC